MGGRQLAENQTTKQPQFRPPKPSTPKQAAVVAKAPPSASPCAPQTSQARGATAKHQMQCVRIAPQTSTPASPRHPSSHLTVSRSTQTAKALPSTHTWSVWDLASKWVPAGMCPSPSKNFSTQRQWMQLQRGQRLGTLLNPDPTRCKLKYCYAHIDRHSSSSSAVPCDLCSNHAVYPTHGCLTLGRFIGTNIFML